MYKYLIEYYNDFIRTIMFAKTNDSEMMKNI